MKGADVIVIGGGIAGAGAAFHLAPHRSVILLESESQLAHHTTGRSAAIFLENYGGFVNRRLSIASRSFLESQADGLADSALLTPLGFLDIGGPDAIEALTKSASEGASLVPTIRLVDEDEIRQMVPAIRPGVVVGGVWEPNASIIDVMGLHQALIREARRHGLSIERNANVRKMTRRDGVWLIETDNDQWLAPVVVNAAGAWGDVLAASGGVRGVGLQPMRRTAFTVATEQDSAHWPFVNHENHPRRCYFKPEAGGQLMVSPADESLSEPCDARAAEIDVAGAIEAINGLTNLDIRSVKTAWAGLRTFAPDRNPVIGQDDAAEGFFWMVGQGGTGIQTAPASGRAVAALVMGEELPSDMIDLGLVAADLAPHRFRDPEAMQT